MSDKSVEELVKEGVYRILHHQSNWDGSKATHPLWRVERLGWSHWAGEFTSEQLAREAAERSAEFFVAIEHQRELLIDALREIATSEIPAAENAGEMVHQRATYKLRSIAREAIGMSDL